VVGHARAVGHRARRARPDVDDERIGYGNRRLPAAPAGHHRRSRVAPDRPYTPGEQPMVYTALMQRDHTAASSSPRLIRADAVQAHLVAGTAEPPATGPQVKSANRLSDVVAAFNSAFNMSSKPAGSISMATTSATSSRGRPPP
jgi:hypothetical protein